MIIFKNQVKIILQGENTDLIAYAIKSIVYKENLNCLTSIENKYSSKLFDKARNMNSKDLFKEWMKINIIKFKKSLKVKLTETDKFWFESCVQV